MSRPAQQQLDALLRLWEMAQRDHGGARVVCRFLLGLYHGRRFPFDLTDVRLLDASVFRDVMVVLVMDQQPIAEVHELLNTALGRRDIGHRMELLACNWRLKGKCSKDNEKSIREHLAARSPVVTA
jgi:hypothetical protein